MVNVKYHVMAFLILFIAISVSESAEWEYFMQSNRGDNYYLDLGSIERSSSGIARIVVKVEPGGSSAHSSLISHIEMDCKENRVKTLKETAYNDKGKGRTTKTTNQWRHVTNDEIDELLLELVCSLKKQR